MNKKLLTSMTMHLLVFAIFLNFGCGLVDRDDSPKRDDGEVGEDFEFKSVNTDHWQVWYPVRKDKNPAFSKHKDENGSTRYIMSDSVTDDGTIHFDFIETICSDVEKYLQNNHDSVHGSEVFYNISKNDHCAILRFYTNKARQEPIDRGTTENMSQAIILFTKPI